MASSSGTGKKILADSTDEEHTEVEEDEEEEEEETLEHFDDFTLASSWERFISEIEGVCRLWMSDGPKNLLVKGAVLLEDSGNLYKVTSETKYALKTYCMEYYFEANPADDAGKPTNWNFDLHDLQLCFGVKEFLVIAPQSASGVVLDAPEASKLLSAVAIALSNCSSLWPAFVPVHDPSRKAYIGIQSMGTVFTRRFEADRIGSQVPIKLMHLEGLYELFVSKFAYSTLDLSVHNFKVRIAMKLTFRTLPFDEDYTKDFDAKFTKSGENLTDETSNGTQWDDDCSWSEWYSAEDPVKGFELITIWSEKMVESSMEMAELENASPHEAEKWLVALRTTTHPYKLNFQYSSNVQHLPTLQITKSPYHFVPISDIVGGGYDQDYLPDVMGVLTGVGSERELEKNGGTTKLNVIALEADGFKIQCTLFGNYCDELNNFIATGDVQNAVVIIQLAKAKTFQDKVHLQNCMACTRLIFNPNCEEARVLRNSFADNVDSPSPLTLTQLAAEPRVSPLEEFLYNTPRTTIQGLKDATTDSLFVVLGTIKKILNPENFWYTSCSCSKAVIPDSQMYFCEKCDRHVVRVYPRFCIKVRVLDNTDCGSFVIFDNDATLLFRKTCQDVLDSIPRGSAVGFIPNEVAGLVDQTLLFKVETKAKFNMRFEQSFRVRKICNDANVINEFKKKWDKEDASFSKSSNENASLSTLMDKGKQLLLEGPSDVLTQDIVCLSSPNPKLKGKVGEGSDSFKEDLMTKFGQAVQSGDDKSPTVNDAKRSSPTNQDEEDMDLPLKLLKRSIKVEKL